MAKIRVPVVSTTHYDREWRFSLQQSRAMLLDLMDHLIDILEGDPKFICYHLDSQSVILEDYLSLRPERKSRLQRLIESKRIIAGPWYSLPDMNVVGGEAIIRNLRVGHRLVCSFGPVSKVGYTPTGFGQISQLPQIYNGFGIDTALFYRGADRSVLPKEFIWRSRDGSLVLTYIFTSEFGRMPLYHCVTRRVLFNQAFYERELKWDSGEGPFRLDDERSRWNLYYQSDIHERFHTGMIAAETQRMLQTELKSSALDTFLCIDGTDSTEPQPLTPALLEAMNQSCETHEFVHTSIDEFAEVLRKAAPRLKTFSGEMHSASRDGVQTNLFGDTISARTDLKISNARSEKKLIHQAEPFASLAWLRGMEYPFQFLDEAWRLLLNNQSHDCIAGCGQDIVHDDMQYYYRQIDEIADEVTRRSLFHLAAQLNTGDHGKGNVLLVVYNPLAFSTTSLIECRVDLPSDWQAPSLSIRDLQGNPVPFEVRKSRRNRKVLIHRPKDSPGSYTLDSWWIRLSAEDLPPLGWKAFIVETCEQVHSLEVISLSRQPTVIENDFLSVEVNPEGGFNVTDKRTNQTYTHLNRFEDTGEAGDAYFHIAPEDDVRYTGPEKPFQVNLEEGAVSSQITVSFDWHLPEASDRKGRSTSLKPVSIKTTAILGKQSDRVDFITEIRNTIRNHRLRVLFPTHVAGATHSIADMPFDVLERPITPKDTNGWFERGYPNHPMRHFCAVHGTDHGLAVLAKGLCEYEVYPGENPTLAVTLLRTSAVHIPKVKEVDFSQEGSQQLGTHSFEYSLIPWNKETQVPAVYRKALEFALSPEVAQVGGQKGHLPLEYSFVKLPSPIELVALKPSDQRNSLICRVWNSSASDVQDSIHINMKLEEAWSTNLNEERIQPLEIQGTNVIPITLRPHQIFTIELVGNPGHSV